MSPSDRFEIWNEATILCEDLKMMAIVTDRLFTGEYQGRKTFSIYQFLPEPDGYRIGDGGRIIANVRM